MDQVVERLKSMMSVNNKSVHNHTLAQYYVGLYYQSGHEVAKDEKLAFEYFKKIANKNFIFGEFQVGYYYDNGIGIKKDAKLAKYWYEKAASGGHPIAMFN